MIVWIYGVKSCCTSAVPSNVDCMSCCRAIIENFKFILMGMSVELSLYSSKFVYIRRVQKVFIYPNCHMESSNCHHPMEDALIYELFHCFFQLQEECHEATASLTVLHFCYT
jgi:hypothetical protein